MSMPAGVACINLSFLQGGSASGPACSDPHLRAALTRHTSSNNLVERYNSDMYARNQKLACYLALVFMACHLLFANVNAADYTLNMRQSTPGFDINCGQKDYDGKPQSFCKVCGDAAAVADSCDSNPNCAFFDMEGDYCGYLKAAGGQQEYTEGFTSYCKVGGAAQCKGDYTFKRRSDITNADINCNYKDYNGVIQPYCKINGDISEVAAACSANPQCKAFTYTGYEGYLKSATSPLSYTEGSTAFVKRS